MCWTYFRTVGHSLKTLGSRQKTRSPPWCPKLVTHLSTTSNTGLAILSWDILVTWPNHRAAKISLFVEVARHSRLEFHNRALCREVPHRELVAKTPSLPFVLEIVLLGSIFSQHLFSRHWAFQVRFHRSLECSQLSATGRNSQDFSRNDVISLPQM